MDKRRAGAALREQIARAALTVFAEKGYAGATIQQIAARAAVNPATVYRFYRGKRDLFDSLQRPDLDFPDQREQEVRASILRAALVQFSQKGYAITMDEIAEAVGFSKAGVYFYFPSKDALFTAVLDNPLPFDAVRAALDQMVQGPGAALEDGLVRLVKTYLSFFKNETFISTLRIILSEGARNTVIAQNFREKIVQYGSRQVAGYLQPFCNLDLSALAVKVQMLIGMVFAWAIMNLFLREDASRDFDLDQVAREYVRQFLYGMQPYLKEPSQQEP